VYSPKEIPPTVTYGWWHTFYLQLQLPQLPPQLDSPELQLHPSGQPMHFLPLFFALMI
jgi:hypothetical protein